MSHYEIYMTKNAWQWQTKNNIINTLQWKITKKLQLELQFYNFTFKCIFLSKSFFFRKPINNIAILIPGTYRTCMFADKYFGPFLLVLESTNTNKWKVQLSKQTLKHCCFQSTRTHTCKTNCMQSLHDAMNQTHINLTTTVIEFELTRKIHK